MNLEDISRFTKNVYKYENISLKHVIGLTNYTKDKDGKEKYKSPVYEFDLLDKKIREVRKTLTFTTSDFLMLGANNPDKFNKTNTPVLTNNKDIKPSGYLNIQPEMFRKVKQTLSIGVDWLVKDEFAKLFTVDTQGNTVGLSDNNTAAIARFPLSWLMIKPAVIFIKEVGYQGIYFKSDKGIIGSMPGEEYITFTNTICNIMDNFYQASLELYNSGMLTLILRSINEKGTQ